MLNIMFYYYEVTLVETSHIFSSIVAFLNEVVFIEIKYN